MRDILHDGTLNADDAFDVAFELRTFLGHVLSNELRCEADVSLKGCIDVIYHFDADMVRHHGHQDDGISPAKHISYLSFWIRKLKPISSAYKFEDIDSANDDADLQHKELHDINERVAIAVMVDLLRSLILNGHVAREGSGSAEDKERRICEYFEEYMSSSADPTDASRNNYDQLIYDMRYRTFGPHHMTHVVSMFVFAAQGKRRDQW